MKSLTTTLFTAALLFFAGSTFAATIQDRHLSGFNAIQLSASYDVYVTQGATESVKVEAPDDVISHIVTEVEGGVLKIHEKSEHWTWSFGTHKKIVIYVTAKDLNSIAVSGSGDVYFKEGLTTNSLRLKVSGSGDVTGKLNTKTLEATVSGSGDVRINGTAGIATVSVSGSGDYTARDLATATTMIRVSGSGDAVVNASEKIDAAVSGSGDIKYTGGATHVSTSSHGSGDIHRI
jgi:hypothetical protein